jgi:PAS domain S-box-containing protein
MIHVAAFSGYYDYSLVLLSVFIAVLAAYAALDLAGRVTTARGRARQIWLWCGAVAMGIGIWAMHYVGMEAFHLPVPVMYDWPTVLLSLLAAVLASGVALYTVSRPTMVRVRVLGGGLAMGAGIAAMHYIGMEAMRLPAMCVYSPWLVLLSIVLAMVISFVALQQTFQFRETRTSGGWRKASSALLMGLAIPIMHYVGMSAVSFVPRSSLLDHYAISVSKVGLACIVAMTLVVLGVVFASASVDRRLSAQSEQFAENVEKLQAVFYNLADAVVVIDISRGTMRHNAAAAKLLGIEEGADSLEGIAEKYEGFSPTGEMLPPERWPIVEAMHGVYRNNVEITIRKKDTGAAVTVEISTAPIATFADGSSQVIVTLRDITARKAKIDQRFSLQEQELEKSRLQLQLIFDNMTEGIVVLNSERKTVLVNPAAVRLLSLSEDSPSYQNILEQFDASKADGKALPSDQWPTARALRGEFVQNYELLSRRKSTGEMGALEISTAPVANGFGESGHIIVTYRDITERKQMDDARNRLAAIVESSEDAIISKSDCGIVTTWNGGAEKLFGYTAQEMIGRSITCLFPDDRLQEEVDILRSIKLGETIEHIETVRKAKNGTPIQVSLTISPIRDGEGRIIGASKIARNITERKQLQNQLYQSQKMEAIGQLTGGIAHDFNNLLGVILGNLDLLEMLVEDNEGALKRIRTAQTAATRGADLIRRLLATSSNVDWIAVPTKLQHSVRNMMDLAHTLGPDIKITLDVDDAMPSVLVDAAGLESALLNLAVNARDAMPQGGTLSVSSQISVLEASYPPVQAGELKAGRYACVSVADTGHGMSRETLARVFEPFFTTKPRGKGTGLGLAMVYGFAKQSGGTVRIHSEPGYGTTVSLYLPLAYEMDEVLPSAAKSMPSVRQRGTVLLVDDEAELVEVAKTYLEDMGYTVYEAEDGPSALAMVEKHGDIDLVVTDILMPGGMNGVELAKKVRESLTQVKIIYCSGFPANSLAERSLSLSDGPLVHKPYQRLEFGTVVRAVMDGPGPAAPGSSDEGPGLFADEDQLQGTLGGRRVS